MRLIEAIGALNSFDVEGTIYAAQPWTENATAIVAIEPASGGLSSQAKELGLEYFLEVSIAREFIDGWKSSLRVEPTPQQQCTRLIQYAVKDA